MNALTRSSRAVFRSEVETGLQPRRLRHALLRIHARPAGRLSAISRRASRNLRACQVCRTEADSLEIYAQERADELLEAIDAVVGKRSFCFVGESFVGSHVGAYLTAKRPEQVSPELARRLQTGSRLNALDPFPSGQSTHSLVPVLAARVRCPPVGSPRARPRAKETDPSAALRSPPDFASTLTAEWLPLCAANKFGDGDGTGAIPEPAMAIVGDYFFSQTAQHPDRQRNFLKRWQEARKTPRSPHHADMLGA